jgi:hypothetical protein
MKSKTLQNISLTFLSFFLCLILLELSVRLFISPSQNSYGILFGHDLPPVEVIPEEPPAQFDRSKYYDDLTIGGHRISIGDLWGFHKEDSLLGYVPRENTKSLNGWWQSNNLGARNRRDISKENPEGKKRIIVLGESYANCSRVPQEESWPDIFNAKVNTVEVINFGVDGYSMGQSFLRFQQIKNKLNYDIVLLMFAPTIDLWREINIIRPLKEAWDNYFVMPRFIVEKDELLLIKSPFKIPSSIYKKNGNVLSQKLRTHLRKYDRFYFKSKYEESWFIDASVIYKLFVNAYSEIKKRYIIKNIYKPDSEAMQVTKRIFETMNAEVKKDGNIFALIFLPVRGDIDRLKRSSSFQDEWDRSISSICENDLFCIDLTKDLMGMPESDWDNGYDGTHFGPKTNRYIAESIKRYLISSKIL